MFPAVFINESVLVNSATCFGYWEPSSGTFNEPWCKLLHFTIISGWSS